MTATDTAIAHRSAPALLQRAGPLIEWLHQRPTTRQLLLLLAAVLVFQLVWSGIGLMVVAATHVGPVQAHPTMRWLTYEAPLGYAMAVLGAGVLVEELVFRLLPLTIGLAIYRARPHMGWLLAIIVVVSSVAFGLIHGLEWYRLALQAVGGLLFAIVFLKTCGMSNAFWVRAIVTTYCLHLAFNSVILLGTRLALAWSA